MRRPRDIQAELKALKDKQADLRQRHRHDLADLLEKTGAAELNPDLLAGLLLEAVDKANAAEDGKSDPTIDRWRRAGEAFFRNGSRQRNGRDSAPSAQAPAGEGASADHA